MLLKTLPLADPGRPELSSPLGFLRWLQRGQRRGQVLATCWSLLEMGCQAALPLPVGLGVQAVVDGDSGALWRVRRARPRAGGGLRRRHRSAAPPGGLELDPRRLPGPAAGGPSGLPPRLRAVPADRHRRDRRGRQRGRREDRLVRRARRPAARGDRGLAGGERRGAGHRTGARAGRAARRAGARRLGLAAAGAVRAPLHRAAGARRQGDRAGRRHGGRTPGAARHRRRGALPRPLPGGLPEGPRGRRPLGPDLVPDAGPAGAAARAVRGRGHLVRRPAGGRGADLDRHPGRGLRRHGVPGRTAADPR